MTNNRPSQDPDDPYGDPGPEYRRYNRSRGGGGGGSSTLRTLLEGLGVGCTGFVVLLVFVPALVFVLMN